MTDEGLATRILLEACATHAQVPTVVVGAAILGSVTTTDLHRALVATVVVPHTERAERAGEVAT